MLATCPRRTFLASIATSVLGATLLSACGGSAGVAATTGSSAVSLTTASTPSASVAITTGSSVTTASAASSSAKAASTTAAAPTATPVPAVPTTAAAPAAKANANTLHIMDFAHTTPESQTRWAKEKAAFQQKYPGVVFQEDFTNDFSKKLPILVASGTPPDVAPLRRQAEFPAFAPYDVVIDLSPYLARSKVIQKADFYESALSMQMIAGKLYALPNTLNPFGLFYNKDLFAAQGVKLPDSTWDYQDWLDAATKLNKYQSGNGTWTQVGGMLPSWWTIHYAADHGWAFWQGGPTQPGTCTRVNMDQPGIIQTYQWYQQVTCKDLVNPTDKQQEAQKLDFTNGNVAMWLSYDQRREFTDKIKGSFKWDWALPPLGDKKQPRVMSTIGGGVAIFVQSKVKDIAWEYLEFTNDPTYLIETVKANGASDSYANRKVQESPEYQASSIPPLDKKILVDAINTGRFFPEPYWEMKALKIAEPSLPKGTPDPASCGADAATILTEQAKVDNQALKAHALNVCA